MIKAIALGAVALFALAAQPSPARAEASVLRAAKQFGIGYIQYMIMEDLKLVEQRAKAAGLGDVTVEWNTFRSSDVMNDALISGNVDFVSLGVPGIMTIWDRTKGNFDVRAAAGLNQLPLALMVRDDIKSLRDFKDGHKIALPAVRVSNQAIFLQMAAEKEWGPGQHTKLDSLTVSMAHPDATIAMVSGNKEITANFSSPPFQQRQAKTPGVKRLLTSTDILGASISFNVVATTAKFRTNNPKLYKAYLDALEDATVVVNTEKQRAAEIFLKISKDRTPVEDILALLNDPELVFTTKVSAIEPVILFMARTGNFKNKPTSGKDLLFPEAQ